MTMSEQRKENLDNAQEIQKFHRYSVISRGFCFSLFLTSLYVDVKLVGLKVKKNACFTTYADIQIDLRLQ